MQRKYKIWVHYVKNIIATDISSAVFLESYLRRTGLTKDYLLTLEVADLQKYKLIKRVDKVRAAVRERANIPFIFVICKN